MDQKVMTCLTCRVAFADLNQGREHYKSEWHRYNTKRKVAQMDPLSADAFRSQMAAKEEKMTKDSEAQDGFCTLCNKVFRSKNALDSHLRSKKHRELQALAEEKGVDGSQVITRSVSKTSDQQETEPQDADMGSDGSGWEDDDDDDDGEEVEGGGEGGLELVGELLGLEECLFCSHISPCLEDNLSHMTRQHSFFLPDAEFISDLEGLVVYLGEMISQGHMCLWCQDHSKLFRSVSAVQKHMVDKGHCKLKHDDATRHNYVDFYDYRSSYPDAGEAMEEDETVDPEEIISSGFELVLPSGSTIGHRSLASYYKQNHGRRQVVPSKKTQLSKVLANYKALGWTGSTGAEVKQRAKDVHYLQRMKQRFHMKMGVQANKMQFHYRPQNPI